MTSVYEGEAATASAAANGASSSSSAKPWQPLPPRLFDPLREEKLRKGEPPAAKGTPAPAAVPLSARTAGKGVP
eukprot:CAMPEP_0117688106 /NCGR_PEP_ID=MMETSP0804-20121206/23603_1 /TAXON_ID=1074897 /ORGANISM="Tetraselmis astigmatica, Strain CCMP880" /LENGTH=73 /DNA_ID=CAMNT_0005500437 /DNA_START=216 /DNA_END=433 /DNA_ORIENTATION=+